VNPLSCDSMVTKQLLSWLCFCVLTHGVSSAVIGRSHANSLDIEDPQVVTVGKKLLAPTNKVMNAIDQFRAKICADMKDEHGRKFDTFDQCHKFMKKACDPGKDRSMDGDDHEVTTTKGYCKEYFPPKKEEKKAPKEEKPKDFVVERNVPGPSPGPGAAPAPAPSKAAPVAAAPAAVGPAPSPGPMGAPASPVPGPFTPGIDGGKPWYPVGKDEKYYFKADGKDPSRLHMSEKLKVPVHGYWGKLVEHEDMKTGTDDWMREFGPNSGHQSISEICSHHPDSVWCMQRQALRRRSSSPMAYSALLPFALAVVAAM